MNARHAAYRVIAATQGSYFLLTGVWPLLHMRSFLAVTGPKTDLWLVETVGVLVAAIGAGLLLSAARGTQTTEIAIIAVLAALGLAAIDVIYVTRGVISRIYLADAALEAMFIAAWAVYAFWLKGQHQK
jgi:hypothetical protein